MMKQITLTVPDHKYSFFIELVKSLNFVEVAEDESDNAQQEILRGIEQGFKEIKLVEEGKMKSRPAKDFLDEL